MCVSISSISLAEKLPLISFCSTNIQGADELHGNICLKCENNISQFGFLAWNLAMEKFYVPKFHVWKILTSFWLLSHCIMDLDWFEWMKMTKVMFFSESPLTIKKKLIIFKLFGIMDFDGKIRAALEAAATLHMYNTFLLNPSEEIETMKRCLRNFTELQNFSSR